MRSPRAAESERWITCATPLPWAATPTRRGSSATSGWRRCAGCWRISCRSPRDTGRTSAGPTPPAPCGRRETIGSCWTRSGSRTGLKAKIISNSEQRFLTYKAIAGKDAGFNRMIQKGTATVDVGFGGMQITLFDKDALVTTQNLPLGVMRLRAFLKPPAERQPGEPHGASGRDGGQRALHLPQDVPEGPGDQKSDRHGEHGDPSGQTFHGERAGGVDLRRGLPGILQEGDGHEPQPEGGCLRGQPGVRGPSHPQRGHLPQSAGADRGGDHVGAGSLPPGRYGGGVRRGDQAGEIQTRFLRRHHRIGQSHRQAV